MRDLARIGALETLPRLLALAAAQTARLFNASELAAPFQQSRPTIRDYVTLLERVFLLYLLPPWHTNRTSRPKLHAGDTGVACALLGLDAAALVKDRETLGPLLETFVFQELRRQAVFQDDAITFHHFRDVGYFLTWNCKHIANATMRHTIERVCTEAGYDPTVICTPEELSDDEGTRE